MMGGEVRFVKIIYIQLRFEHLEELGTELGCSCMCVEVINFLLSRIPCLPLTSLT